MREKIKFQDSSPSLYKEGWLNYIKRVYLSEEKIKFHSSGKYIITKTIQNLKESRTKNGNGVITFTAEIK